MPDDRDESDARDEPGLPDRIPGLPGFDLSALFQALSSPGVVNWAVAGQIAQMLATVDPDTNEPRPDPPVGPEEVGSLRGLAQAAQSYVAGATGLTETLAVPVDVVTRVQWTTITLEALAPVLEALATRMAPAQAGDEDPFAAGAGFDLLGAGLAAAMAPMLFGMQAGSLAGMLSQYALGQYDLPLPLAGPPRLAFIATNIGAFASDWELPPNDLRFALALREVAHAAERTVPWVRERLVRLSSEFVSGYELRPELLEEQFGGLGDLGALGPDLFNLDPQQMESRLGGLGDADPNALLDGMRTDAQRPVLDQLVRFGAVLEGYADVVVELVGAPLIPELTRIEEALRRHRVERGRVAAFVERMLGLEIDREHYEAGAAFCRGVTERAGIEGLNRLWEREAMVPTAAELEAPGLWLARIELAD